jgi:hypothetical protein
MDAPTMRPHRPDDVEGDGCPPVPEPIAGLEIGTGGLMAGMRIDVIRAVSVRDPGLVWTAEAQPPAGIGSDPLLGGRDAEIDVWSEYYDESDEVVEMRAVRATFQPRDGTALTVEVKIVPHENSGRPIGMMIVPDVDGTGILSVEVEWSDRCYEYTATGAREFTILSLAITSVCPQDMDQLSAYLDELRTPATEFDGMPIELLFSSGFARYWPDLNFSVSGPVLTSWDRQATGASGSSGTAVAIVPGDEDLRLREASVSFYRRGDVVDYLETFDSIDPVVRRDVNESEGGRLWVRLPGEPGRYVAMLAYHWRGPCANGGGVAVFSVDVE